MVPCLVQNVISHRKAPFYGLPGLRRRTFVRQTLGGTA